jgi:predicted glycoside hydrolase/deacetylase ChbG (UPF0249 family)
MRVIINADDFALRESVSLAICECFRRRLITQTTIMVNMPFFLQAVELAKKQGISDRIGLHLNLTFGFPLTDDIRRSRLFCDPDGRFSARFHLSRFYRMWLPRFERMAVAKEIKAQMSRYVETGFPLMHLDSHHHSHTDIAIAKIAIPLAEHFGFKSVRLSRNLAIGSFLKRLYKKVVNRRFKHSALRTGDYFAGGVSDVGRVMLTEMPDATCMEVMTHPRYEMINGRYVVADDNLYDFKTPISVLEDQVARMQQAGMEFITFGELR